MRLTGKILTTLALSVYALCALALVLFSVPATGLKAKSVATGSMQPAIPPGSLVIIQKVPLPTIKSGDVVTYVNPRNTKQTITHRVVSTQSKQGVPHFVTKGDANSRPDQEIVGGLVVGKVVTSVPVAGKLADWLKTPLGLVLVVVVPGLLIILYEARRMHRVLAANPKPGSKPDSPEPPASSPPPVSPIQKSAKPAPKPKRGLDGLGSRPRQLGLYALVAFTPLAIGLTFSVLTTNTVTLADTKLTIAATPSPTPTLSPTPSPGCRVVVTGVGSKSKTVIVCKNTTKTKIENNNQVTIINNNQQNSTTGNVNGPGTSGNSGNNNSTNNNVNVSNPVLK